MASTKPILFSYFRSSCSWRVRIALALKGIEYEYRAIHLVKGEQNSEEFKKINPQGAIPALVIDGKTLTQSVSIIEYLEETRPSAPLLPKNDAFARSEVRRLSLIIAADIQPLQNLRVLKIIGDEKKMEYGNMVITKGFEALEKALQGTAGKYCYGDQVTMADLCLVPQVYNANRFKVDMTKFPIISRIESALGELPEFKVSHPSVQPDCPDECK